jgi:hypothetical protein
LQLNIKQSMQKFSRLSDNITQAFPWGADQMDNERARLETELMNKIY